MPEKRKDLIWILRIALFLTLGLLVYFVIMIVILPVSRFRIDIPVEKSADRKLFQPSEEWRNTVGDSINEKVADIISSESFLLSKLQMTKSDSISLAVSLKDSSVSLVIQGVTIYKTKIESYNVSTALRKTDPYILAHWLAKPFVIDTHYASIQKAPVLYKKAPKDTIEAMNQLELDPFKDDLDPVYICLNLDRKLKIIFEQSEPLEKGNLRKLKGYRRNLKAIVRKDVFDHLLNFTPIEFVPELNIVINKKAARVIYRALPVDALVAVQL